MLKHKEVKEFTESILLKAELIIRESSVSKKNFYLFRCFNHYFSDKMDFF